MTAPGEKTAARLLVGRIALLYLLMMVGVLDVFLPASRAEMSVIPLPEANGRYAPEELDAVLRQAIGNPTGVPYHAVRKWTTDTRVRLYGNPSAEDRSALRDAVAFLDRAAPEPRFTVVEDSPAEIHVHILPRQRFREVHSQAPEGVAGCYWAWWRADGALHKALVLVDRELDREERAMELRSNLLRATGFLSGAVGPEGTHLGPRHSMPEKGYGGPDGRMVEILYQPALEPGMMRRRAEATLRAIGED